MAQFLMPNASKMRESCLHAINPFTQNKDPHSEFKSTTESVLRSVIRINVNGRVFDLGHSTCIRIPVLQGVLTRSSWKRTFSRVTAQNRNPAPNSLLGKDKKKKDTLQRVVGDIELKEELYFQRNPSVFAAVVDYVQNNELHVPPHICPKLFARDLNFWGFDIDEVEGCCFPTAVHFLWERQKVDNFHEFLENKKSFASDGQVPGRFHKLREVVWDVLDEPYSSLAAQIYFYVMCVFILLSFCVIAVDTVDSFKVTVVKKGVKQTQSMHVIDILSDVCAMYLYVDFSLRLFFCPKLTSFFLEMTNITDMLVVLSSIVKMVTDSDLFADFNEEHPVILNSISTLKFLRIMRLLRPMSKVKGFRLIFFTLKCSFHELVLVLMLLGFLTMVFATLLYYMGDHESFKSIPHAMWFALTTMTTVGYGDIIPSQFATKIIGSVVAVFGIIMMSMTMPIMVSNFHSLYTSAMLGQPVGGMGNEESEEKEETMLETTTDAHNTSEMSFGAPSQQPPQHQQQQKRQQKKAMKVLPSEKPTQTLSDEETTSELSMSAVSALDVSTDDEHSNADNEDDGALTIDEETSNRTPALPTRSNLWRHRVNVMRWIPLLFRHRRKRHATKTFNQLMASLKMAHRLRQKCPRFRHSVSGEVSPLLSRPALSELDVKPRRTVSEHIM